MSRLTKKPVRLLSKGGASVRSMQASSLNERKAPITLPRISMEKPSA